MALPRSKPDRHAATLAPLSAYNGEAPIPMRLPLILLCLFTALSTWAQTAVRIVDSRALHGAGTVRMDDAVEAALAAYGATEEQALAIKASTHRSTWPEGLRSDSAMDANTEHITTYHALRMCSFQRDSTMMAVVKLPAAANAEMPWDLCPEQDVYLEVPERALRNLVTAKTAPATSKGPSWAHCAKVRIEDPERVYAAYDIAADSAAVNAMLHAGMSRPEIDAVAFRSVERNWPEGIDSFEKRWPALEVFKKYRAYLGARWGDKALLIVPVEENLRMPLMLRPYMDMYFVYDAEAVAVKGE